MPFTPFHFGPGGLLHAAAPRKVSFLAFAVANVLVDMEPGYFMLTGQDPLHRFFHTYLGVTLVALATFALFAAALRAARSIRLPNPFQWQGLRLGAVAVGAVLGACSHILLDSVMHADIRPLAPFSQANPLYRVVPLDDLHRLCVVAGAVAVVVLAVRHWLQRRAHAR
jgi:membrane-bound metal-dependent hydrolase YbcI (DUF457 family)